MDYITVTEMQCAHEKHIDHREHKANAIGPKDEGAAESLGHNNGVVQRTADSDIAIIGH